MYSFQLIALRKVVRLTTHTFLLGAVITSAFLALALRCVAVPQSPGVASAALTLTPRAYLPLVSMAPTGSTFAIPLTDPGPWTYHGFTGGLYPGGHNDMPTTHAQRGLAAAANIRPRNTTGIPDMQGHYVLMSVGMSNTAQEFCNASPYAPLVCRGDEPFIPQALADAQVNYSTLRIVNGARGLHAIDAWDTPDAPVYDWLRDSILAPQGLSEVQVQVIWLKNANRESPLRPALPNENADAYVLITGLGNTLRALAARYPNLQQVYLSSRTYGGYATGYTNSPEPYAYETGFAVKWLIEAQIRQLETGIVDMLAGDLGPESAPWIAWGPYLWADGMTARADGLVWYRHDFVEDGIHPSVSGRRKVGLMLLRFFKTAPTAQCWFLEGEACVP